MKIVTKGIKNEKYLEIIVKMNAPEELLTAIVPVIVCEQIANGDINKPGAFTGHEVVNVQKFLDSLKEKDVNYQKSLTKGE